MRRHTAEKVQELLQAVASTLQQHGRPRMLPGNGWRPEAVNASGRECRPTHHKARQWSLLGAIKADGHTLGFNRYVRETAACAILDATDRYAGEPYYALAFLDGEEYDTRQIVRIVKRAHRQLAKAHGLRV